MTGWKTGTDVVYRHYGYQGMVFREGRVTRRISESEYEIVNQFGRFVVHASAILEEV